MSAWISLRTIPTVLGLMIRAPGWAIDYILSYRRAKKEFQRHLIDQGVPHDEAEALADLYPFRMSDLIETARSLN